MGFSLDISVPVLTVFFQGLISFFSPCVLPLIPLYIGYLSGGTGSRGEDGRIYYKQGNAAYAVLRNWSQFRILPSGIGIFSHGRLFQK